MATPPPHLTRRSVLRGAAALGVLGTVGGLGLVGCGGDDGGGGTASADGEGGACGDGSAGAAADLALVSMVDAASSLAAGAPARVALGLGDASGALLRDVPASLTFEVQDADCAPLVSGLEVARHDAGLPRAYFPLVVDLDEPGFYRAVTEVDGSSLEAAFQVVAPGEIAIPRPGEPFPEVTTPTVDAPDGVDPVCTQEPACPLHDVELTTVLGQQPVALLVSTPAFCQTAICGPVLDLFVAARDEVPDVAFLHAEVYASAADVEAEGLSAALAPAVEALGLPFEPCLFLIGADGVLVRRVDVIYDEVELREGLAELTT